MRLVLRHARVCPGGQHFTGGAGGDGGQRVRGDAVERAVSPRFVRARRSVTSVVRAARRRGRGRQLANLRLPSLRHRASRLRVLRAHRRDARGTDRFPGDDRDSRRDVPARGVRVRRHELPPRIMGARAHAAHRGRVEGDARGTFIFISVCAMSLTSCFFF